MDLLFLEDFSCLDKTYCQLDAIGDEMAAKKFMDVAVECHDMARKIRQFQSFMLPRVKALENVFVTLWKIDEGKVRENELLNAIEKYRGSA